MANVNPTITSLRRNMIASWSLGAGGTDTGVAVSSLHVRKSFQVQLTGTGTLVIETSNDNANWTTEETITATGQFNYPDSAIRYWRVRQTAGTGTFVVTATFEGAQ